MPFDNRPEPNLAVRIIEDMLVTLGPNGECWTKHRACRIENGKIQYCIMGSVTNVQYLYLQAQSPGFDRLIANIMNVIDHLYRALPVNHARLPQFRSGAHGCASAPIAHTKNEILVMFNDSPDTTFADIKELLLRARSTAIAESLEATDAIR